MISQQYPSLSLDPSVNGESDPMAGPMTVKAYELKGFMFSVLTMCLKHTDVQVIEYQLRHELAKLPDVFSEPLVIDLHEISKTEMIPDFHALISVIRGLGLVPIGICNGNHAQITAARSAGMPTLEGGAAPKRRPAADLAKEQKEKEQKEQEAELRRQETAASKPVVEPQPTHIIDTPVRTGQRVFSKGDLTLLAGVNAGAEVLAAGSIHVYGPLRGRALAGVSGDTNARIFTKCMEAELVSIAGCFRVLENDLGADVQGKPAQIYLDGERVVIKPV